jgi:hypothetical protein
MNIEMTVKCEVCENVFSYIKDKSSKPNLRTCSKKCSYDLRKRTRSTQHAPLEKVCLDCSLPFLDTTKKKLNDRCKSCVNLAMVETRRSRGNYVRSEEQNEKLSLSLKKKYETGWNPNTEEHKTKLSEGMKRLWADGTMKQLTVEKSLDKWGVEHWTKSEEGRQFASSLHRGRKHSIDARKNMSQGAARRVRENNNRSERGNGGYREDLGHYVRSNWEANFARILKLQGRTYEYEPRSFELSEGRTYTPDFLVDCVFYEVKGYWTELAKQKLESFMNQYPDVKVQIIDGPEYDKLRQAYRDLVLWEGK